MAVRRSPGSSRFPTSSGGGSSSAMSGACGSATSNAARRCSPRWRESSGRGGHRWRAPGCTPPSACPVMFTDPHFLALGVTTTRDVVPWDIVTRRADRGDLAAFRAWLRWAESDNVTPLISFGADYRNPAANYVPTVGQYRSAVKAFLK